MVLRRVHVYACVSYIPKFEWETQHTVSNHMPFGFVRYLQYCNQKCIDDCREFLLIVFRKLFFACHANS